MSFFDKNGNLIQQVTTCKAPLRDEEGNIVGLIGNSINISQRKKAEDILQQTVIDNEAANEKKLLNLSHLHQEIMGSTTKHDNVEEYLEMFIGWILIRLI